MFIMLAVQRNMISKRFLNAGYEKSLRDSYLKNLQKFPNLLTCNYKDKSSNSMS